MKIVTDCAADIPVKEASELEITQAPLYIQFPEGEIEALEIGADDFYNRLERMRPAIPTTAQPSSGMFAAIYKRLAQAGETILSIHISSGLSGTINAARTGAEQAGLREQVTTWDTLTLSGGERFQVLAAARAARLGWSLERIIERLEKVRSQTEVIYTLDTLEYLARGGRIGRVQALAGSLLKLKPVIRVAYEDGKYSTAGRGRTIAGALDVIAEHLHERYRDTPLWVTILHGRFQEGAEALGKVLSERLNSARDEVMRISPVLGVHTGPRIVGAAVVPIELLEPLG